MHIIIYMYLYITLGKVRWSESGGSAADGGVRMQTVWIGMQTLLVGMQTVSMLRFIIRPVLKIYI